MTCHPNVPHILAWLEKGLPLQRNILARLKYTFDGKKHCQVDEDSSLKIPRETSSQYRRVHNHQTFWLLSRLETYCEKMAATLSDKV